LTTPEARRAVQMLGTQVDCLLVEHSTFCDRQTRRQAVGHYAVGRLPSKTLVIAPRGRKSAARTLGRFRFAARRLRCRRTAWRRGNGPAKHLDSIAVSIKLTQCHYVCDSGILAFLIETVFAARIEACCSILGNDLSQCGYSPLMSGDYDASAHFCVSISHTINMGAREAGRHGK